MNTFIITAGGVGKRMGSAIPKQFLEINGAPLLMQTISVFHKYDPAAQLIVTLPIDWWDYWKKLCANHNFQINHELVEGGKERFDSIKNALKAVTGAFVGIHDGVRPLVSTSTIDSCLQSARMHGAAIPVIAVKESIRKGTFLASKALNRSEIYTVQTPQCFKTAIIKAAYENEYQASFTDDASVAEAAGNSVQLVEGNEENIKITTPFDMRIAEVFLKNSIP
jgi:2-C-methyl-D-erythritol 4-phosphate cytidylyltransferase